MAALRDQAGLSLADVATAAPWLPAETGHTDQARMELDAALALGVEIDDPDLTSLALFLLHRPLRQAPGVPPAAASVTILPRDALATAALVERRVRSATGTGCREGVAWRHSGSTVDRRNRVPSPALSTAPLGTGTGLHG
ncbi:MAG: hypothetical protein ACRDQX_01405 [Pseudonocardiaceae bacterium]